MKIFGFRWKRYVEWRAVLHEERKSASLLSLLAKMAWVLLTGIFHLRQTRKLWRSRMRTCMSGCPIYDPEMKRCRRFTGSQIGCGCYCPWIALFYHPTKPCWIKDHAPEIYPGW